MSHEPRRLWHRLTRSLVVAVERVFTLKSPATPQVAQVPKRPASKRAGHLESAALAGVRAQAENLMAKHGLNGWVFELNKNVRRAGVCRYPTRTRPERIELSRHFVERNLPEEVTDSILHEIAHALVGPAHGHDAVWKTKCVEIGARPERCYGEEIEMPKGRWRATCLSCSTEFDRHRKPKRMTGWFCRACGKDRGGLRWERRPSP